MIFVAIDSVSTPVSLTIEGGKFGRFSANSLSKGQISANGTAEGETEIVVTGMRWMDFYVDFVPDPLSSGAVTLKILGDPKQASAWATLDPDHSKDRIHATVGGAIVTKWVGKKIAD